MEFVGDPAPQWQSPNVVWEELTDLRACSAPLLGGTPVVPGVTSLWGGFSLGIGAPTIQAAGVSPTADACRVVTDGALAALLSGPVPYRDGSFPDCAISSYTPTHTLDPCRYEVHVAIRAEHHAAVLAGFWLRQGFVDMLCGGLIVRMLCRPVPPLPDPYHLELKILQVPCQLARVGVASACLRAAGYEVVATKPGPGQVQVVSEQLTGDGPRSLSQIPRSNVKACGVVTLLTLFGHLLLQEAPGGSDSERDYAQGLTAADVSPLAMAAEEPPRGFRALLQECLWKECLLHRVCGSALGRELVLCYVAGDVPDWERDWRSSGAGLLADAVVAELWSAARQLDEELAATQRPSLGPPATESDLACAVLGVLRGLAALHSEAERRWLLIDLEHAGQEGCDCSKEPFPLPFWSERTLDDGKYTAQSDLRMVAEQLMSSLSFPLEVSGQELRRRLLGNRFSAAQALRHRWLARASGR
ncbi:hypothetical protein HYH02_005580 [Chlamydomonas schloesseri]|uniref:Uncharacterized protein n=1 Tax=Chlamydomonas schloesseri TaxID=2026947 RepID=A0A835WLG2_9CHLO|nr:hypothetical protein HYH02_005580 [Chlamydomonas schloesseri]|eukprot:KAG2449433.1 hypothetical protein HYH02_005580 [Chlamydomonas schloesseri]